MLNIYIGRENIPEGIGVLRIMRHILSEMS